MFAYPCRNLRASRSRFYHKHMYNCREEELKFIYKEEFMGHGFRQTLLRGETCAHHVLTGTYDKRMITGLNCSY